MQQPLFLYTRSHISLASYNNFGLVMHMHLCAGLRLSPVGRDDARAPGVTQTACNSNNSNRQQACSFGGAIISPDKLLWCNDWILQQPNQVISAKWISI